ncbi:hypothetical protein [Fimbriiglobus ruber]|uniref:Uncharacterized protein n=1 Tax=Fimbriiglobus ruber TaxID=1908690 RepID=A0A225E1W1_9BACT|nr:hypothetical protein [Fimbriiglobus ruber]OWK47541.1 hypothetical protein FRUB_01240 [Fimbriiglobus ruber]
MVTAYVSLHTGSPESQLDQEVSYEGYSRLPVEFSDDFGNVKLDVFFPAVLKDSGQILTYIAIGAHERGQGEIFLRVSTLPMLLNAAPPEHRSEQFWIDNGIPAQNAAEFVQTHGSFCPHIVICNTDPVVFPKDMNPIARTARKLFDAGMLDATVLPPKLYEAINDELQRVGVPIIPVTRTATATMTESISKMKSLRAYGVE